MTQSTGNHRVARNRGLAAEANPLGSLWHRLRGFLGARNDDHSLRETIEEIIEEIAEEEESTGPIGEDERVMLANILKLRHVTAYDVMVPRADIVAVDSDTGLDELIEVTHRFGHSRFPVFRESLDDVAGLVHIKDLLPYTKGRKTFNLASITRTLLFVAPSMRVLELLLEMRQKRVHMALVVDEFGGVDGLTTIEDLVEEIVGEIEDEHDVAELPKLLDQPDASLIADARTTVEEFEARVGRFLSEEEREEDIDTLGGLVFYLADRIPGRGELILHPSSGISFEVMDADPRRIKRLRVRNLSSQAATEADG